MTTALAQAQREAADLLVGRYGIIGVGRSTNTLIFFVQDHRTADPIARSFAKQANVNVEVSEVEGFDPAD